MRKHDHRTWSVLFLFHMIRYLFSLIRLLACGYAGGSLSLLSSLAVRCMGSPQGFPTIFTGMYKTVCFPRGWSPPKGGQHLGKEFRRKFLPLATLWKKAKLKMECLPMKVYLFTLKFLQKRICLLFHWGLFSSKNMLLKKHILPLKSSSHFGS